MDCVFVMTCSHGIRQPAHILPLCTAAYPDEPLLGVHNPLETVRVRIVSGCESTHYASGLMWMYRRDMCVVCAGPHQVCLYVTVPAKILAVQSLEAGVEVDWHLPFIFAAGTVDHCQLQPCDSHTSVQARGSL